jgi:hypothetical protein
MSQGDLKGLAIEDSSPAQKLLRQQGISRQTLSIISILSIPQLQLSFIGPLDSAIKKIAPSHQHNPIEQSFLIAEDYQSDIREAQPQRVDRGTHLGELNIES